MRRIAASTVLCLAVFALDCAASAESLTGNDAAAKDRGAMSLNAFGGSPVGNPSSGTPKSEALANAPGVRAGGAKGAAPQGFGAASKSAGAALSFAASKQATGSTAGGPPEQTKAPSAFASTAADKQRERTSFANPRP